MILVPTPSHFENSKEIVNAIKYRIEYFLLGEEGTRGRKKLEEGGGRGIGEAVEGGGEREGERAGGGVAGEEIRRGAVEGVEGKGGEGGREVKGDGGNEGLKEKGKRIIERGENKRDVRFLRRWVETQSVVYFLEGNEDV